MAEGLLARGQREEPAAHDVTRQWASHIGFAAAIGFGYFLAADFSVRLLVEPEGVAVFWPAAGISSGILIAFGMRARWPVLAGVIGATLTTHLLIKDPIWAGVALGLCNGAEALITAGLIHYYFGAGFGLGRLRHVIGLFAAAVAGTAVSGIGGAVTYRLFQGPSAPMLNTWQHWFASDAVGIIAVARNYRRHSGTRGARDNDCMYYLAAARALGDGIPDHLAVSNFLVACRALRPSVLCRGRVRGFNDDRVDDNLGRGSFR